MRKDPTEFRQRFAAWKNGEQVYEHGLPKYAEGIEGDIPEWLIKKLEGQTTERTDNTSVKKLENKTYIPKDVNISTLDKQTFRDRMYKTVSPTGYTKENAKNFIKNKNRSLTQYSNPNTEGVYGLYTNQDSIIAQYDQTVGPNFPKYRILSNEEKHQLDSVESFPENFNLGKYAVKDILQPSKYKQGAYEFIHPYDINPFFYTHNLQDSPVWRHNHTLGSFKTGAGIDKNGVYDWYEDRWDINPSKGVSSDDDTNFTKYFNTFSEFDNIIPFGNPIKIYGRKYRKDLPKYRFGTEDELNMGERKQLTQQQLSEVSKSTIHEQPVSNTDPVGEFIVNSVGATKGARIIGDILTKARLGRMADTYRQIRKFDNDKQQYTGKSLRKENIRFADKMARESFTLSRPENPLYWIMDPIVAGYSKLQSHPVIGPLIPF